MNLAALKGVKGGTCNVTACQKPPATFFNKSTRAYYCAACAEEINWPGGRADCMALYGTPLLCEERDPEEDARAEVIRYTANAGPAPGESGILDNIGNDRVLFVDDLNHPDFANIDDVLDLGRLIHEGFHGVKTIRGPRVGRKPTKAMKKAAKKARRA